MSLFWNGRYADHGLLTGTVLTICLLTLAMLLQKYPCPQADILLPVLRGILVSEIRDELEAGKGDALQYAYLGDRIGQKHRVSASEWQSTAAMSRGHQATQHCSVHIPRQVFIEARADILLKTKIFMVV